MSPNRRWVPRNIHIHTLRYKRLSSKGCKTTGLIEPIAANYIHRESETTKHIACQHSPHPATGKFLQSTTRSTQTRAWAIINSNRQMTSYPYSHRYMDGMNLATYNSGDSAVGSA